MSGSNIPSPEQTYANGLLHLREGLPVWNPKPPPVQGEVHIGDVGYFRRGQFYRFFNTFSQNAPGGADVHNEHDTFAELELPHNANSLRADPESCCIRINEPQCSSSIKIIRLEGEVQAAHIARGRFSVTHENGEGAMLLIHDKTRRDEFHDNMWMKQHVLQNFDRWVKYIQDTIGASISEDDVYFVRGFVKTKSWTIAAFQRSSASYEGRIELQQTPVALGGGVKWSNKTGQSPRVHSWPHNTTTVSLTSGEEPEMIVHNEERVAKKRHQRDHAERTEPTNTGQSHRSHIDEGLDDMNSPRERIAGEAIIQDSESPSHSKRGKRKKRRLAVQSTIAPAEKAPNSSEHDGTKDDCRTQGQGLELERPHDYSKSPMSSSAAQTAISDTSISNPDCPPQGCQCDSDLNQCIFLHYYKVKRRRFLPRKLEARAGPHTLPPDSPPSDHTEVAINFDDDDETSVIVVNEDEDEQAVVGTEQFRDPVDDILTYILSNSSANIAMASDADAFAFCTKHQLPQDFLESLQGHRPPIDVDPSGVGTLRSTSQQYRHASSPQPYLPMQTSRTMSPPATHLGEINPDVTAHSPSERYQHDRPQKRLRCKKLKMICEFPPGQSTCKRCKSSGHSCLARSHKPQSLFNDQYLDEQIYHQDVIIESLLKSLHRPVATPLSIATNHPASLDTNVKHSDAISRRDLLPSSIQNTSMSEEPAVLRLSSRLHRDPNLEDLIDDKTKLVPGTRTKAEIEPEVVDSPDEPSVDPVFDLGTRTSLFQGHRPPEIMVHGLVTSLDVDRLFEIFFTHLNPHLSLLDRELHTPAYTSVTCPFLFTAICAVSWRYYKEKLEMYPIAMYFAECAAAEGVLNDLQSEELAQAYILMSHYSRPTRRWTDDKSWLYTSLAVRVYFAATEAAKNTNDLKSDAASADPFSTIRHPADWYKTSSLNQSFDIALCAYTAHLHILAGFHDKIYSDPDSPTGLNENLDLHSVISRFDEKMTENFEEWIRRFHKESDMQDPECRFRASVLLFLTNSSRLVMYSFGLQHALSRGFHVKDMLFLIKSFDYAKSVITAMVESLAPSGYMRYSPDAHFIYASFASVVLLKLTSPELAIYITEKQTAVIFDLIGRLIQTFNSPTTAVDDYHTPKLHARFLTRLLSKHRRGVDSDVRDTQPSPQENVHGS
ncbi:hypothetical protein CERSUDRAFT_77143 [Gelatoporia subvermispora B]|uniref:Zn(2)-C6 fungal-type domain-containing protein n=1 Tax=Ceriporiopsis subvermispora (strain B) TaxID=914234 RepID=M2PB32_CERS8|nr:hypothetical protein CERSUDRAFT_77143 [Gelatoporia subvermispora B]